MNELKEVEVCNNDESLRFRCGDLEFVVSMMEVSENEDLLKSLEIYFEGVGVDNRSEIPIDEIASQPYDIQPLSRRLDGGEAAYQLDCALGKYAPEISFSRVLWEAYLDREVPDDY